MFWVKKKITVLLSLLLVLTVLTSCSPFTLLEKFFHHESGSIEVQEKSPVNTLPGEPGGATVDILKIQAEFDAFMQDDFLKSVLEDTLSMHSYVKNPKDFGIESYEVGWGDLDVYPSAEVIAKDKESIKKFYTFDREQLTAEQQRSYDIYAYDAELYDDIIDTWMMYDPLVGANGSHAIIPFMMNEYTFYTEQDVKDYLELVEEIDLFFSYLAEWQQERSKLGLFMSDKAADKVIETCRGIIAEGKKSIFITGFNDKVDELNLEKALADGYKKRNDEIYTEVIVTSYENLISVMEGLKGTGENRGGLAKYDKGKEYYALQLKKIGLSMTAEELISMCDEALEENINALYSTYTILSRKNKLDSLNDSITPEMQVEDIIKFLISSCKPDFPELPDGTTYSLKLIAKSMRDTLSPGFYFSPPIDYYKDSSIYYNPEYLTTDRDYMFFLLAHEGIPGHLLQQISLLNSSLPDWRKIQGYRAYSEGWAQYVQYYSYGYVPSKDKNLVTFSRLNEEIDILSMTRIDLGIHYEGWTQDDLKRYLKETLPYEINEAYIGEYYDFILDNPQNSIPYIGGVLEIRQMYKTFKEKLGRSFTDKEFHTELLKYGEAPFALLRSWMDGSLKKRSWWQ